MDNDHPLVRPEDASAVAYDASKHAANLEANLGEAIDNVLDWFEICAADDSIEPMSVILERLRARGVELPAWVEMMV